MAKIDTLDELGDEMTSILGTHSEHTLNTLWTHSEHTLNIPWAYTEHTLKICPRVDKISKTWINDSLTDSPTWIQEMLAHLKRPSPKERHKNLTMAEVYMYLSKKAVDWSSCLCCWNVDITNFATCGSLIVDLVWSPNFGHRLTQLVNVLTAWVRCVFCNFSNFPVLLQMTFSFECRVPRQINA